MNRTCLTCRRNVCVEGQKKHLEKPCEARDNMCIAETNAFETPEAGVGKSKTAELPTKKRKEITKPENPEKAGKMNVHDITDDTVLDLSNYRNGINQNKPNITTNALIKYYFVENKVAEAHVQQIYEYFRNMTFYKTMEKKRLEVSCSLKIIY